MKDLKELVSGIAAALTVFGAIIFGAQRVAYERFYDEFGVAPEDVGLDAARSLSQTASGVCISLAICVLPGIVIALAAWRLTTLDFKHAGWMLAWLLAVGSLIIFINGAADADDAGRCAARADGQSVRSLRIKIPFGPRITLLGARAERAVIRSADPSKLPRWEGSRVVYLGARDATTIVYVPGDRTVLRLPSSSVAVTIDADSPRFRKKLGCARVA